MGQDGFMSESEVIDLVLESLEELLIDEYDAVATWAGREKCVKDGGRVDGLVVGMRQDYSTVTIAVEAKSLRTLRQVIATYRGAAHLGESLLVGALTRVFFGGLVGVVAGAANQLLGGGRHTESEAANQACKYPGDYRVLAVPHQVLKVLTKSDEIEDLIAACNALGVAILRVKKNGNLSWDTLLEHFEWDGGEDEEWLDCYMKGEEIRSELEEALDQLELDDEEEDENEDDDDEEE